MSPRTEADAQIARALQIVCDAGDEDETPRRDYTPKELETLFFSLSMAMIQLAKLPGGKEAKRHFYESASLELLRRGRPYDNADVKAAEDVAGFLTRNGMGRVTLDRTTVSFPLALGRLVKMLVSVDHDHGAATAPESAK